jgi:hypothetical protein
MPANEMARWFGEGPPQRHSVIYNRVSSKISVAILRVRAGGVCHAISVLVGTPDQIPVAMEFLARPFDEALLFEIASAYEAGTKHRRPPKGFGPLADEP